ncbi:8-oxo-dGTP diphosphatase MutT [Alteromonas gilva]|uniref:8-oxo-dGTP diphosphatase n=1 Tax=Alteromonas gilva TaxID=2987522 RepID=A0ABT5L6E6_9ALTE|nr:8-oxo-dGTP diphosphatase MutT [Alteromonas gilva]MDC8832640.1 8-oxo-dGTP diphosphatase MutT [Alteromonas gilva]
MDTKVNYIDVAVGVILRDQKTYVCLRPTDKHQGGKWEFPGGKIEAGEAAELALARELMEEVAITVTQAQPLTTIEHDYGDKCVRLFVFAVTGFDGEPTGAEGQSGKWLPLADIDIADFPAANREIIEQLRTTFR